MIRHRGPGQPGHGRYGRQREEGGGEKDESPGIYSTPDSPSDVLGSLNDGKRQISTGGRQMPTKTDEERRNCISDRLVSLVDMKKTASAFGSVYRMVRVEFEGIEKAREVRIPWKEIAETCGFPGKESRIRDAYMREKRRRAKPAMRKKSEEQEGGGRVFQPVGKASPVPARKTPGQRTGPVTLLPGGKMALNDETPDDEL